MLIVRLRSAPTGQHFDPEQARVPVLSPGGGLETLKIVHPWQGQSNYQAIPGRFILHDRLGKVVEAFTFGGELRIESDESVTTCTIHSEAPILALAGGQTVIEVLAEEVEILLAEQQARWVHNPEVFEQKLAALKPLDFYSACLITLREKFKHLPVVEGSPMEKLTRLINSETHLLQDRQGSSSPPRLLAALLNSS